MPHVQAFGFRERILVGANDLWLALAEAGVAILPGHGKFLPLRAAVASRAALRVVSGQLCPSVKDIRRMAGDLGRFEKAAREQWAMLTCGLPPAAIPPDADRRTALIRQIGAAGDPGRLNMLEMIAPLAAVPSAAAVLADKILELEATMVRAAAARQAVEAGARREAQSQTSPGERDRRRDLGLALIDCYVALTGRDAAVSRKSSGDGAGDPSGPLIRFLRGMFLRMRSRLARWEDTAALASSKVWTPSDETLVAWAYRFLQEMRQAGTCAASPPPAA